MAEMRDTAIKLFGRTIPLRPSGEKPPPVSGDGRRSTGEDEKDLENKEATTPESKDRKHESTDAQENNDPPVSDEISKPPSSNKEEDPSTIDSKSKELEDGKNQPKEKGLKKPDKILPCPRCNSMDTKFCYYNNYNLNQPRHFCKKCQRYWTAGGTMRNVPVGSGRRKNKNSASHYRHIVVSDSGLQAIHAEVPEPVSCPPRPNGASVLSFGFDNSMNSCNQKRFQKREEKLAPPSCSAENVGEQSSESSVTTPNSQVVTSVNEQATQISTPCCKGSPWPYPCIPAPFVAPSFPIPFFPVAPYWSCAVPPPEAWSIPWISPIASSNNCCQGAGNNSSTLGKHSRDGTLLNNGTVVKEGSHKPSNQERCIWFPKTLRIDDPKEAAMSSIWATIGVKNDKADAISGGGLFKAFQPKIAIMNHTMEASQLLHANPAAVSRSINFHESW